MQIIDEWQYGFIERGLYQYKNIIKSDKISDRLMVQAINLSLKFFDGEHHQLMLEEYYFKADEVKKRGMMANTYHEQVCYNSIFISVQHGYVIRREIVYRTAMNCYALGLFKLPGVKKE